MDKIRLFGFSFLILFVELALIRFIPGNIRVFSYFNNLILIASFLGIGLGFILSRNKKDLEYLFPFALTALGLVIFYSKINVIQIQGEVTVLKYFSDANLKVESIGSLLFIFSLVTALFTFLANAAGKLFSKFKPLVAYSTDIAGSIFGIVAFSLISYFSVPAIYWFFIIIVIYLALVWKRSIMVFVSIIFLVFCFSFLIAKEDRTAIWSPYFKITYDFDTGEKDNFGYWVKINNFFHQFISSQDKREEFYYYPYTLFDNHSYKNILIIGSGNGVDAAVSLARNPAVESIDAIEIDPEIVKLGQRLNVDKPYDDPRVNVYVEDGRGFLERTEKKYDLIIYAETDAVVLVNNSSGVRLESFLYTLEAFSEVKNHLTENGVFFQFNYYVDEWVIDKLALMTERVFGQSPYMLIQGDRVKTSSIIAGPKISEINIGFPNLKKYESVKNMDLASDDWPFLFLKQKSIPIYYLKILLFLGLMSTLAYLLTQKSNSFKGLDFRFAAFGVGFMLLETKSLLNFSQLFGTTWVVNSLVIIAILSFVLLANFITSRFRFRKISLIYSALFTMLLLQLVIPNSFFASFNLVSRYLTASIFYFAPIFLANMIFAYKFKNTKHQSVNFGINMLGGVVGGLLEYSALLVGYQALIVFVIASYAFTLTGRKAIH
jgi:hypothetical protein